MTDTLVRFAVPATSGAGSTSHYLRLGPYVGDEPSAWQPAGYVGDKAAHHGIYLRTSGQIVMVVKGNALLDFNDGQAIVVSSGNRTRTVGSLASIAANGIYLAATSAPPAPFSTSAGAGNVTLKSAGEVKFLAADAAASISLTAKTSLSKTLNFGMELYFGSEYKVTFGAKMDVVLLVSMSAAFAPNQTLELHRWRFRVLDTKWAASVLKLLGRKVDYKGVENKSQGLGYIMATILSFGIFFRDDAAAAGQVNQGAANQNAGVQDLKPVAKMNQTLAGQQMGFVLLS